MTPADRSSRMRQGILRGARAVGVERHLRTAQQMLGGSTLRRDLRDGEHLRVLLAGLLTPRSVCVDVGANVGDVLEQMVRCAPEGLHHAVEPLPDLAARLRLAHPSVTVHQAALAGSRADDVTFYRNVRSPARSSLRALGVASTALDAVTVPVRTLDELLGDHCAPALVKIDVEGAEAEVLRGAMRTLERAQPVVVLEHGSTARHFGSTSEEVHDLLSTVGLRVYDIDGHGPYRRDAFVRRVVQGDLWTFVARL